LVMPSLKGLLPHIIIDTIYLFLKFPWYLMDTSDKPKEEKKHKAGHFDFWNALLWIFLSVPSGHTRAHNQIFISRFHIFQLLWSIQMHYSSSSFISTHKAFHILKVLVHEFFGFWKVWGSRRSWNRMKYFQTSFVGLKIRLKWKWIHKNSSTNILSWLSIWWGVLF
jgi:hypothetical protein